MPKFRNNSRHMTYDFIKKGGKVVNGVPETVSIGPGEESDLDLDLSNPKVAAAIAFGDLQTTDSVRARAEEAMATEEPTVRRRG